MRMKKGRFGVLFPLCAANGFPRSTCQAGFGRRAFSLVDIWFQPI